MGKWPLSKSQLLLHLQTSHMSESMQKHKHYQHYGWFLVFPFWTYAMQIKTSKALRALNGINFTSVV